MCEGINLSPFITLKSMHCKLSTVHCIITWNPVLDPDCLTFALYESIPALTPAVQPRGPRVITIPSEDRGGGGNSVVSTPPSLLGSLRATTLAPRGRVS